MLETLNIASTDSRPVQELTSVRDEAFRISDVHVSAKQQAKAGKHGSLVDADNKGKTPNTKYTISKYQTPNTPYQIKNRKPNPNTTILNSIIPSLSLSTT